MNEPVLEEVVRQLLAPTKGILAADWTPASATKHFDKYGIVSNEESRRDYRQLLFTTPGIEEYISGVILQEETLKQSTRDGNPFPNLLQERGIIPGIKVDRGTVEMPNFPGEVITEGLDGLRDRLIEYAGFGARFTKWRAVIAIGEGLPTLTAMEANAHDLARYASFCQELDLVPIVEPEVLLEGDYSINRCQQVTEGMLKIVFRQLEQHRVYLPGMILKPNMVQPGKDSAAKATPEEVAVSTIEAMKDAIPSELSGIAFLSGGQSPEEATANLNAINKIGDMPWQLTFSYARALQQPVLENWKGQMENYEASQNIFLKRAKLNSLARQGKYEERMEGE